jgi:hypothetical protein
MKNKEDIKQIYYYLWSLGILETKGRQNKTTRRDSIIEAIRSGRGLDGFNRGLFSDEEFIILRGMITEFDRDIKLNKILDSVILETKNIRQS